MADHTRRPGILSWSQEDRPREKLLAKGPQALTLAELLAIFIRTGTKKADAVALAKQLLERADNDLDTLASWSIEQLMKEYGIGEAKAVTIAAALELGRRRKSFLSKKNPMLTSSKLVYDYLYPLLADVTEEHFQVVLLKRSNEVIKTVEVSKGGLTGTTVDPKIIFKPALDNKAAAIIICHNHPSGNLKPSPADISLTQKIKQGAELLDIQLLDHIVFCNNGYFSFADEGIL